MDIERTKQSIDDLIKPLADRSSEYLFIVRINGKLFWRSSDTTWATGAATRYLQCQQSRDDWDEKEQLRDEP